jgi:hypothetical protein
MKKLNYLILIFGLITTASLAHADEFPERIKTNIDFDAIIAANTTSQDQQAVEVRHEIGGATKSAASKSSPQMKTQQ